MRLKSLTLKAFRSFVSQTTIEFPDSGLLLIQGPSGHGKSSILLGVSYALGFCPFSAKDLQSDDTEEDMVVRLELSGPNLTISRGAETYLELDGVRICNSAKDLDRKLNEITGLSPEFRELLTYRDQDEPHRFLKLSNADANELLCKLLGLESFLAKGEALTLKVKELGSEVEKREATLAGMDRMLGEAPVRPEVELESLKLEYDSNNAVFAVEMENYRVSVKALEETLEIDLAGLKSSRDRLSSQRVVSTRSEAVKAKIEGLEAELHSVLAKLTQHQLGQQSAVQQYSNLKYEISLVKSQIQSFEGNLERNQQELAAIQNGNCGTCGQAWVNVGRIQKLESLKIELEGKLAAANTSLAKWQLHFAEYPAEPVFSPNPELELAKKALEVEIKAQKDVLAEISVKDRTAEVQAKSEILELNSRMASIQADFVAKTKELQPKSIELAQKDLKNRILMGEKALLDYETVLAAFQAKFQSIMASRGVLAMSRQSLEENSDALDFTRSFTNKIFGEVLAEIGDQANAILSHVPNTAGVSIEFLTEKELTSGKTKSGITPVVRFNGKIRKLKAGASGGMKTVVELATDMALSKVVEARTGIKMEYLLLDEAFEGLDANSTETVLTMLAEYAKTNLVVVISHGAEIQAVFDRKLTVSLESESEIKWD